MVTKVLKKALEDNAVDETKFRLSNNSYLKARNFADSADVNLLRANSSDQIQFASEVLGPNANAPTLNESLANKKYVDDRLAEFTGALVYRGTIAGGSDLTGFSTGNSYIDAGNGYNKGDYFKASSTGNLITSNGNVAVSLGDNIYVNQDFASNPLIVVAGLDIIDNTESPDILRSGDLSSGEVFIGSNSNIATPMILGGDVSMTSAGVVTIQTSAVTTTKINNAAVTESKLDSSVDAETFVIASGYDASTASGNVFVGSTIQEAIRRVEKKANDALGLSSVDLESFIADGVATNYILAFEPQVDSLKVFRNGLRATNFTINYGLKTVIFSSAPENYEDLLFEYWKV